MRKIIHVDMDCFFAAVEMRDFPQFKNVPLAIGGTSDRRGVISTCNYEARKFGVRSAMPTSKALRLCPRLVLRRHRGSAYKEASQKVMAIFLDYTDKVQSLSLDEAYLDVTDADLPQGSATLLAQVIRQRIFEETGLTASAGIASNKLLAKLASEVKKPNGQFTIAPEEVEAFMSTLPLSKINGIGKVTTEALKRHNLITCKDVLPLTRLELVNRFGKLGMSLYESCRGIHHGEVVMDRVRKSLSQEETFAKDLDSTEDLKNRLYEIFDEMMKHLKKHHDRIITALQVKIKYHDFKLTTIERTGVSLNPESAWALFLERWSLDPRPIRLIGVGVKFKDEQVTEQLSFDALSLKE
jgi:DNA polymerase IV